MDEKKDEDMDVAEDLYVANDLYEEDEVETGIRRGASPTRDGGPSPPRVQAMEVDSGARALRTAMRGLFGDVVELLKDRANRDLISKCVDRTQAPGPDRPPGGLPSGVWYTPAAAPLPARAGEEARGPLDSGSLPPAGKASQPEPRAEFLSSWRPSRSPPTT